MEQARKTQALLIERFVTHGFNMATEAEQDAALLAVAAA